jgi:hypothetical protein
MNMSEFWTYSSPVRASVSCIAHLYMRVYICVDVDRRCLCRCWSIRCASSEKRLFSLCEWSQSRFLWVHEGKRSEEQGTLNPCIDSIMLCKPLK